MIARVPSPNESDRNMSLASRFTRPAALSLAVLLSAGFIAACGGSDAPSKEDFIAEADQICADFNEQATAKAQEFQDALNQNDLATAASVFEDNAAAINTGLDEIEDIGIPDGDQETLDEWISLGRQQADLASEVADAVANGDGNTVQAKIEEGDRIQTEADRIADDYGMVDCGSAGSPS
jgi:hypothetical protein